MQIFEITQRKRTNEGVLSTAGAFAKGVGKSLVDKFVRSTLPGVSAFDEPDNDTSTQTPAAPAKVPTPAAPVAEPTAPAATTEPTPAKGDVMPTSQKFPTFGTGTNATPTSVTTKVNYNIPAVQRKQAAAAPAQPTATTPSWVGTNTNVPAVLRKQKAQAQAQPQDQTPAQPAAAKSTPAVPKAPAAPTAGVVASPGHRIVVQAANGGKYYKTEKGWANELGQAVSNAGSIATLEKLADAGGREEKIPTLKPAAPSKVKRTRKRR